MSILKKNIGGINSTNDKYYRYKRSIINIKHIKKVD